MKRSLVFVAALVMLLFLTPTADAGWYLGKRIQERRAARFGGGCGSSYSYSYQGYAVGGCSSMPQGSCAPSYSFTTPSPGFSFSPMTSGGGCANGSCGVPSRGIFGR